MEEQAVVSFLQTNSFIAFSALLLIGVIGGRLAHFSRFLPRITGYIIAGFVLGPHVTGVLTPTILDQAQIFSTLAISLILFELGTHINLNWLFTQKRLLWMSLLECFATFLFIFATLMLCKVSIINALLIASIGIASSPAITMLIAEEYDAKGPVIDESLFLTGLNNVLAFCFFSVAVFFSQIFLSRIQLSWWEIFYPFYNLFGCLVLGVSLSAVLIWLGKFLGKHENSQFAALIGVLILAIGLATSLHLSTLLTSLIFGIATYNLDRKHVLLEVEFGHSSEVFFVILFVFAGANLHAKSLFDIGWVAFAFILARFLGKLLAIGFVDRVHQVKRARSLALSVTLLPMAGTAIGLLNGISHFTIETAQLISTVVLASIAILETIGPIFTLLSLRMMGELGKTSQEVAAENHG